MAQAQKKSKPTSKPSRRKASGKTRRRRNPQMRLNLEQRLPSRALEIDAIRTAATRIDGSDALTVEEVEYLSKHHVIGSHSYHHVRLEARLNPQEVDCEVVKSRARLEEMTSTRVVSFAWVGGENWSYGPGTARAIKSAGYQFAFAGNSLPATTSTDPFWVYRTNVEADWSIELVKMQLCGLADLWHWPNRISIRRNLARQTKS